MEGNGECSRLRVKGFGRERLWEDDGLSVIREQHLGSLRASTFREAEILPTTSPYSQGTVPPYSPDEIGTSFPNCRTPSVLINILPVCTQVSRFKPYSLSPGGDPLLPLRQAHIVTTKARRTILEPWARGFRFREKGGRMRRDGFGNEMGMSPAWPCTNNRKP